VKLAAYPQETVAALIAIIFFLFSAITAIAIVTDHLIVGIGLALAFGFQLVGHAIEFVRMRRYMPHIVTALITLPYYPWLYVRSVQAGYGPGELILATVGMGAFGFVSSGCRMQSVAASRNGLRRDRRTNTVLPTSAAPPRASG
jgi:hypothetical protein